MKPFYESETIYTKHEFSLDYLTINNVVPEASKWKTVKYRPNHPPHLLVFLLEQLELEFLLQDEELLDFQRDKSFQSDWTGYRRVESRGGFVNHAEENAQGEQDDEPHGCSS